MKTKRRRKLAQEAMGRLNHSLETEVEAEIEMEEEIETTIGEAQEADLERVTLKEGEIIGKMSTEEIDMTQTKARDMDTDETHNKVKYLMMHSLLMSEREKKWKE